jgi:integrase
LKLTAHVAATLPLPAGKSDHIEFDDDIHGFGLRLREKGARTLVFQYAFAGKTRRMSLGAVSALNFAKARKDAERLYSEVKLGRDPALQKAMAEKLADETYGATVRLYLDERKPRVAARTQRDSARYLTECARSLLPMPRASIRRRDVAAVIAAAEPRGSRTSDAVRDALVGFFSWCVQKGYLDVNPAAGTRRRGGAARSRVLLPNELRTIWCNLNDDAFGAIVKLLALTGQREAEIGALRRDEVYTNTIILAAARVKNRQAHTIPLSAPARQIVRSWSTVRSPGPFLFGRDGKTPFGGFGHAKRALDQRMATAGTPVTDWTIHDLRRSFATYAGGGLPAHLKATLTGRDRELAEGLAAPPHAIEMALNHVSGFKRGVAGTYNLTCYEKDKAAALAAWAQRLVEIVATV